MVGKSNNAKTYALGDAFVHLRRISDPSRFLLTTAAALRQATANRSQFHRDFAARPFYGSAVPEYKRKKTSSEDWWRQGMMGGAKVHHDGIVTSSDQVVLQSLVYLERSLGLAHDFAVAENFRRERYGVLADTKVQSHRALCSDFIC